MRIEGGERERRKRRVKRTFVQCLVVLVISTTGLQTVQHSGGYKCGL